MKKHTLLILFLVLFCSLIGGQLYSKNPEAKSHKTEIDRLAKEIESKAIEWYKDFHQNPELGNREFRTAKIVAEHLQNLGIEVKINVAHTGVVGFLRGRKAEPVVALRADMDALPITEMTNLPYASQAKATYNGNEVGVMHACGHDVHTSVLMGVAEVLSKIRNDLNGSVKFIFQPAEEGPPGEEEGGASLMIKEGVLENPKPEAIFGLHVGLLPVGFVATRPGALLASSDGLRIVVKGRQTHAAAPWGGVDPIVVASQIVLGIQTIVSRQVDLTTAPAIISFGSIHGGLRGNIIPDSVELIGTIRALDPGMRNMIHAKVKKTASHIAESAGAVAEVEIYHGTPVTMNNAALTERMLPVLENALGSENVIISPPITGSEDFAFYAQQIPAMFFFLGVNPPKTDPKQFAPPHSPYFCADEGSIIVGIRAIANLAAAYLKSN